MAENKKPKKLIRKQPPMTRVLIALVPSIAGGIYFFGWRSLALILAAAIIGFATEWMFCKNRNEPVSEAVFVTTTLFALVMPPNVPWHVLLIGTIFAVMFTKEVFGGFGRNIFNPALAGRCFVYICFPLAMTGLWAPVAQGPWGALDRWSTVTEENVITGATPMGLQKSGKLAISTTQPQTENWQQQIYQEDDETVYVKPLTMIKTLTVGRLAGTMGVTSAFLITIGGIYLFWNKTASRAIILSVILSYIFWNQILTWFDVPRFYGSIYPLLGGGFLFGAFYMATDPVSSPRRTLSRIIYGIIIGTSTMVIRNFSIFNGGLMFSILIGNMFAPILDYSVDAYNKKKKERISRNEVAA